MKKAFPKMITDICANQKNHNAMADEIECILSPKERAVTPLRSP